MKNNAFIYLDDIGNICFQIGHFHIEYIASKLLTKIKRVLEYDNTGYIVIDTNYGEEFYDFSATLEEKGLDNEFNLKDIMESIDQWIIKEG